MHSFIGQSHAWVWFQPHRSYIKSGCCGIFSPLLHLGKIESVHAPWWISITSRWNCPANMVVAVRTTSLPHAGSVKIKLSSSWLRVMTTLKDNWKWRKDLDYSFVLLSGSKTVHCICSLFSINLLHCTRCFKKKYPLLFCSFLGF